MRHVRVLRGGELGGCGRGRAERAKMRFKNMSGLLWHEVGNLKIRII